MRNNTDVVTAFEGFICNFVPCCTSDEYNLELCKKVLAILKEQEAEISRLSNAYLDLVGKASKQPEIVRCKDCTWWGSDRMCENSDSPCFQNGCTHGNWFCADGEKR